MEQKQKLIKKIAREIHKLDEISVHNWNELPQSSVNFECKDDYIRTAKSLFPIIKTEKSKVLILADKILLLALHGNYTSGVEAFGIDKGRTRAAELLSKYEHELFDLKRGDTD